MKIGPWLIVRACSAEKPQAVTGGNNLNPYASLNETANTYTIQVVQASGGHVVVVHRNQNGLGSPYVQPRATIVPDGADMVTALTAILVQEKLTK